ncbi:unnamed protein product [Gongylonema pulchrum]|uniref:WD_REPEATS_REGION domain-containing protein n=1 Tax=Gongylonema pulchrum TaxID=637853 RepID=A0A183DH70_9BILA|nr:unnamed protein product [Gongylonema pulchrum]
MNAYTGCRTYSLLSSAAQRSIRLWTMSDSEKSSLRYALLSFRSDRQWDRLRHRQLLRANSRFCCWTAKPAAAPKFGIGTTLFLLVLAIDYSLRIV